MPKHHPRGRVRVRVVNRELLRQRLDERNMTIPQLVKSLGCSESWGYSVTGGHTATCSLNLAEKIEALLDCHGQIFERLSTTGSVVEIEDGTATVSAA